MFQCLYLSLSCRVEAIYPVRDPVALQDKRVHILIQYAMKVSCPFRYGWFLSTLPPPPPPPLPTFPPYSCMHGPSPLRYLFQVEKSCFDIASDREDYYKLLTKKIFHIRKELEAKKKAEEGKYCFFSSRSPPPTNASLLL